MPRSAPVDTRTGAAGAVPVVSGTSATGSVDGAVGSATAAGNSSTTFVSKIVGSTSTPIAIAATTLSRATYARGRRQSTYDSSAQPASSSTWGTATSTQRFTTALDR